MLCYYLHLIELNSFRDTSKHMVFSLNSHLTQTQGIQQLLATLQ